MLIKSAKVILARMRHVLCRDLSARLPDVSRKQIILTVTFVFMATSLFALATSVDYRTLIQKVVGSGYSRMVNNNSEILGLGIESIGGVDMFGTDYSITSSIGDMSAPSKLSDNLSEAHCYPNPFKPNSGLGHTKIIFSRLTSFTKLRIYNIAGELVYDTQADTPRGELPWDVVNNAGERVASGVYIYIISNDNGQKKIGKLAVIR